MREKLNSNPVLQAAVIGVLLVCVGFFFLSRMGGGEEEEEAATTEGATTSVGAPETANPAEALSAALSTAGVASNDAPPPPRPVLNAWQSNKTIVLLFIRDDGIDDKLAAGATKRLGALPRVATFIVPARQIFRYAAIAEGVGVERVPALVVVRPKNLDEQLPTASVSYGYQTPQSVVQAVIDAGYKGPTIDYHP